MTETKDTISDTQIRKLWREKLISSEDRDLALRTYRGDMGATLRSEARARCASILNLRLAAGRPDPGPLDAEAEDDRITEATSDAMAVFWDSITAHYRKDGVELGERPQWDGGDTSELYDNTFGVCRDAVEKFVTMRRVTATPVVHADGRGDLECSVCGEALDSDDRAHPRNGGDFDETCFRHTLIFNSESAYETFAESLPQHNGWKAYWEFPGYLMFRRPGFDFEVQCTPDHDGDLGSICVDVVNPETSKRHPNFNYARHGSGASSWPFPNRSIESFMKLMIPILDRFTPRRLVVQFDVTGLTMDEVAALESDVIVQGEGCDDDGNRYPACPVIDVSRDADPLPEPK